MEQTHLAELTLPYQSRLLHATEKGWNLSLKTRHTKINPFSSETGTAFLSEDSFLLLSAWF